MLLFTHSLQVNAGAQRSELNYPRSDRHYGPPGSRGSALAPCNATERAAEPPLCASCPVVPERPLPPESLGSAAKQCLTLCDPMDCSMPGFPVCRSLPEFAQIHAH